MELCKLPLTSKNNFTSELNFQTFSVHWSVEHFSDLCKLLKTIHSPKFALKPTDPQWFFQINLFLMKDSTDTFTIILRNTLERMIPVKGTCSIMNSEGEGKNFNVDLSYRAYPIKWESMGLLMYNRLQLNKARDDTVKFFCKLSVLQYMEDIIPKPLDSLNESEKILEQLEYFYSQHKMEDVEIKVKERTLYAHKIILMLRSEEFARALKSKKCRTPIAHLYYRNVKPLILRKMLQYIYSEKVENLRESARDLYDVAKLFKVNKLMTFCTNDLVKHLSLNTVVDTYELADKHSIASLKRKCIFYFISNYDLLLSTPKFEKLMRDYKYLTYEIESAKKVIHREDLDTAYYSRNTVLEYK